MMFGDADDLCSTVSTAISSVFSTEYNEENEGEREPHEFKYVPEVTVKTEVEEVEADDNVDDLDISENFLQTFSNNEEEGGQSEEDDIDPPVPSRKRKNASKASKEGQKQSRKNDETETTTLKSKQMRGQMAPEENEKKRGKDKLRKQSARETGNIENELCQEEGSSGRRSSKRQVTRLIVKYETEESTEERDDEDYKVEEENDEYRKKKKGSRGESDSVKCRKKSVRKKISEMSEEEREAVRALGKQQSRKRRERLKKGRAVDNVKIEMEEDEGKRGGRGRKKISEMSEKERDAARAVWREDAKKRRESGASTSAGRGGARKGLGESHTRTSSGGGRRRRVSEMTEEEREVWRAKEREAMRLRRAKQRATMSPEERDLYLAQQREYTRLKRERAKVTMTEEQREEVNRKARERRRLKSAVMTPEQKREETQKCLMRRMVRRANWTEEQKQEYRNKDYMQRMARAAKMTPEEIERKKQRSKELRMARLTPQEAERRRNVVKKWRDDMDPDRRQRFLDKLKECYRRRVDRLKQDPQKWEEVKQRWKLNRIERIARDGKVGGDEVGVTRKSRKRVKNEKDKEVKKVRSNIHSKRYKLRRKLTIQRLVQSGMSMDEIAEQLEPPEKRERRLMRNRVRKAKLNLKQQLEKCGAAPEEIEKRLEQVPHTYTPTHTFRPYKPKQETLMPIAPDELALLENVGVDQKLNVSSESSTPSISTLLSKRVQKPSTILNVTPPATSKPRQVRRGRPPKILKQDSLNAPPPNQTPPPPPSPASTSSSIDPHNSHQFAIPHHSQAYSQSQHQYHLFQQTPALSLYQHQPQAYSLQNILDTIPHYHEQGGQSSFSQSHVGYPHQQHHQAHSHQDYASSYASDNQSLPPASLVGGDDDQDDYEDDDDHNDQHEYTFERSSEDYINADVNNQHLHYLQPPQKGYPTVIVEPQSRKRRRARKPRDPNTVKRPRHGPRGPQHSTAKYGSVVRDVVCDDCGNAYNSTYLREHKNQFHNPHYKNQTCLLCGEKFSMARKWYTHYIHNHPDAIINKPKNAPQEGGKVHMCDICGASFRNTSNMRKHKFSMHGDGLKKENFKKCPICPDEKLFKNTVTLYTHFRRKHPEYNRQTNECYRCPEKFPKEQSLSSHVKVAHPECYFPCQYCNVCRFSQLALNFHTLRCTKAPTEIKEGLKKKEAEGGEVYSLDRVKIPCEFCERNVAVFSLTRHYWEMHKVKEDKNFTCTDCGKEFRSREFWLVHMEEKHEKGLDEMRESASKLNVKNREGLEIKNKEGVHGGVPGNTPGKAAAQRRIEEMGGRRRKSGAGGKGKKGGGVKKTRRGRDEEDENYTEPDEESEGDSSGAGGNNIRINKCRRRNIVVVAEEDEEEKEGGDDKLDEPQDSSNLCRKSKSCGTGRRRGQEQMEADEEAWQSSEEVAEIEGVGQRVDLEEQTEVVSNQLEN